MADNARSAISVERVNPADRLSALNLLFQHLPGPERAAQAAAWDDAANRAELSLEELWIARCNGCVMAVLLQVFQPGRVAFVWPPVIVQGTSPDIAGDLADALLAASTQSADFAGMQYSQIVLETIEKEPLPRLIRHGYCALTELLRYERTLSGELPDCNLQELVLDPFLKEDSKRLARLLERTFQGTQDCPEVAHLRSGKDALDRHLGAAPEAARHWLLARDSQAGKSGDVGVLLLLEHIAERTWEIDYFGVVPEARGRGLGKRLILRGIDAARDRGAERIQAVVDSRNHYACKVYDDTEFQVQDRRQALIRLMQSSTVQLR